MKDKPIIIRDSREKKGKGWWFEVESGGWHSGTEVVGLKVGDCSIKGLEDVVAIDRKASVVELYSEVGGRNVKNFYKKVKSLAELSYGAFLFEFSLDDVLAGSSFSTNTPTRVVSHLTTINVKYGVPTIFAGNSTNAALICEMILKKAWDLYGKTQAES